MLNTDRFLAMGIASVADVETIDTYESNISHYEENGYTYIPIPSSNKYYHVTEHELRDLDTDQYFHPDLKMMTAFELLQEHPFLLYDPFMSFESADDKTDRRFVPTGEQKCVIDGEELTVDEIIENSDTLLNKLPDDHPDANIIEAILSTAESRFYIITLADANKRQARELFYHVISEFETQLSDLIESHYPNSFIPEANENEIERWYRAKLDELEIHIAEHMHLSTLLTVGGKNEQIYEEFGFSSRNQFDDQLGGLNNLRNKVMHPTRALIHNSEDLKDQVDRVRRAQDALQHLDREQIQPEYPRDPGR